ncbi:MAG TPA: NUDIX hydrolase [Pyrinomonadaceae bacterium]|nr:NUDIX hydrolase [Pyrinomonadaceae bacterium]
MKRKHGPWTITETARMYRHELIEVFEDQVIKPDGQPGVYATVKIKEGASVLALDQDGFVYLTKEFRYALGRESIEVVSGAIDEGERPVEAAQRELREELGIEAAELIELGRVDPIPSMVDSPSHLFLAVSLKFKDQKQEGSEVIEPVKVKLEDAVRMAISGEITHGSSCVLILRANSYL